MINIEQIPNEGQNQSFQLLKEQFLARGWKVEQPYIGSAYYFIDRGDGNVLNIFSSTPPTTTFAAANLANNKYGSYQLLKEANLPQPNSMLINQRSDPDEDIRFLEKYKKVVVKPVDSAHGKGITVNVTTPKALELAIEEARANGKSVGGAIIQEQYNHPEIFDVRILCIDYKFVAAIWRVPARVFGNGHNTVAELIEIENETERRGQPYFAALATIDILKANQYLGDRINDVPAQGEEVSVLGIANYGAGGETIDVTDDLPNWLKEIAEKAATVSQLPVAGVDFMISDRPAINSTTEQLDAVILEINKCPALALHDMPSSGKARNVTRAYVDYLATV